MTSILRGDDDFDTDVSFIGNNQTWQDVKADRVLGTVYTNNTGNPIQLLFTGQVHSGATARTATLYLNGVVSAFISTAGIQQLDIRSTMGAIIPNESTYQITGNALVLYWVELR